MNRILLRLFSFFIVFPVILGLMFFDIFYHLPLAILVFLTSMVGAVEMGNILKAKGFPVNNILPAIFGIAFPVLGYLENFHIFGSDVTLSIIVLLIIFVFMRQIFTNKDEEINQVLFKVTGNLLILIYPGLFLYFFVKISSLQDASLHYFLFALMTFGNDAMAWLAGNIFGKRSSKPFVVSPNKSTVGFIGGFIGSLIVAVGGFFLFPGVLGHNLILVILLGILVGIITILGDLFESSLKRSAKVKDSGSIIPGRGGILDSIDSLLFVAPLWYTFIINFHF